MHAVLAALDPGHRSLASWFDDVQMPDIKGGIGAGRWLWEFLDYLMTARQSAIIDLGGGDLSLETLLESPATHMPRSTRDVQQRQATAERS